MNGENYKYGILAVARWVVGSLSATGWPIGPIGLPVADWASDQDSHDWPLLYPYRDDRPFGAYSCAVQPVLFVYITRADTIII